VPAEKMRLAHRQAYFTSLQECTPEGRSSLPRVPSRLLANSLTHPRPAPSQRVNAHYAGKWASTIGNYNVLKVTNNITDLAVLIILLCMVKVSL
jgi:hypothetical protein